jgi:ribonuclease P protein component
VQKNTFKKEERLCEKKLIDSLFAGKGVQKKTEFPFILLSKEIENNIDSIPAKVMFSVSKRKIKLAVKRNLLKRRAKEAYRLHKHSLISELEQQNKNLIFCFIYLAKKPLPYNIIEQKIIVLLNRLKNESE